MNGRTVVGVVGVILLIVLLACTSQLIENVDADEIVVCQFPSGDLQFWKTQGWHAQWFGKITRYRKSNQYWFSAKLEQGKKDNQSIETRFQDAGTARISGAVRFDMPLDDEHLMALHSKFGSQEAIETQLVGPTIERAVFMSGPLMSSRQALSTSSARFLEYIEDQARNGVYRKFQKPLTRKTQTGEETIMVESIVQDEKAPNGYARVEQSPLDIYGIKMYNVLINGIDPDPRVKEQIAKQQEIEMAVQTSIAEMNMATQKAETVKKQGEATAAQAEWEQKAIKARETTKAIQEKEVAMTKATQEYEVAKTNADRQLQVALLEKQAAAAIKDKLILEGQGEAAKRRAIIEADGALEQKLAAFVQVNRAYADAISRYQGNLVPGVVMGGSDGKSSGGVNDLIAMFMAKTAKDLQVDLTTGPKK